MTMAASTQTSNTLDTDLKLPSQDVFGVLPALHELLARIERSPSSDPTDLIQTTTSSPTNSGDISAHYQDQLPLDPKDLPTEVLAIKAKIRKALRELEKLPDMELTVEEQESDIRELEGRIERQKGMLGALGAMAGGLG